MKPVLLILLTLFGPAASAALVHFDTEAKQPYILQYTSSLAATSRRLNLFTAPQRFYRLSVEP